jgi:hypothetical protein
MATKPKKINEDQNYSTSEIRVYGDKQPYTKRMVKASTYFYLDGILHKRVRVNRALNIVYCIKFPECDRVAYPWTEVKKRQKRALRISEVALLVDRSPRSVHTAFMEDKIPKPQKAITKTGAGYWYFFSEDDVMTVRDYFAQLHRGRPRKDKMITSWNVPTKEQLREAMGKTRALYVKNDEGEIVPVWIAEEY